MVLRAQEEFAQTFWCSDELTIWSFRIIYGFIEKFCIWSVYQRHFEASQARIGSKTVKKCPDTFSECQEGPKQLLYITWSHLSHFWSISHIGSGGSARWQARDKLLSRDLSRPTKTSHTRCPVTNDDYPCCRQSEYTNWFNSIVRLLWDDLKAKSRVTKPCHDLSHICHVTNMTYEWIWHVEMFKYG